MNTVAIRRTTLLAAIALITVASTIFIRSRGTENQATLVDPAHRLLAAPTDGSQNADHAEDTKPHSLAPSVFQPVTLTQVDSSNAPQEAPADVLASVELPADRSLGIPISIAKVDEYILDGKYTMAADLLAEFAPRASGLLTARIQLRRGLCAELMGRNRESLAFYHALTGPDQPSMVADMANVSAARVLIASGFRDAGIHLLMRMLISRESSLNKQVRGDVLHTLAQGLASAEQESWLLDPNSWAGAKHHPTPEGLLNGWRELRNTQHPLFSGSKIDVTRLSDKPEGIFVTVTANSANIAEVLNTIFKQTSWKLTCDSNVTFQLESRSSEFDCQEIPLDVLLDGLLLPRGLSWTFADNCIRIVPVGEPEFQERLSVADRFLRLATGLAPDHPAAATSYILLGNTAARKKRMQEAIQYFQTTEELFPKTPQAGVTSFNMGKAALAEGKREDALRYFYYTVDHVNGIQIDAAAYVYIGRLLMENDAPDDAIAPLMRGLALSRTTHYEGSAALQLASAYLMTGDVAAANTVLMNHRQSFATPKDASPWLADQYALVAEHAALVSCLARFSASKGPQRIREGRSLIGSLTLAHPKKSFGGHAVYILGVAYGAVGFDSEQEELFRNSLAGEYHFPLQQRMRSLLALGGTKVDFSDPVNSIQSPVRQQQPRSQDQFDQIVARQKLLAQTQEAFRQGEHDVVLEYCHEFLRLPQDELDEEASANIGRRMLRFMGLAYQANGQHEKAVRCLAGLPQ